MKRKLSILLAATMVTSMLPTGVFAASINSVTNTPSVVTHDEWSLKDGEKGASNAPQIVARATSNISRDEQITLTLSGAEWAFYNTGLDNDAISEDELKKGAQEADKQDSGSIYDSYYNRVFKKPNQIVGDTGRIEWKNGSPVIKGSKDQTALSPYGSGADKEALDNLVLATITRPQSGKDTSSTFPSYQIKDETETNLKEMLENTLKPTYKALKEALEKYNAITSITNDVVTNNSANVEAIIKAASDYNNATEEWLAETAESSDNISKFEWDTHEYGVGTSQSVRQHVYNAIPDIDNIVIGTYNPEEVVGANKINSYLTKDKLDLNKLGIEDEEGDFTENGDITDQMKKKIAFKINLENAEAIQTAFKEAKDPNTIELESITTKVVSALNFYDVKFEAANVISFRLNTDLKINEKIAIPLLAKVYDDAPTVTLTSATGQFSSSTYQFAKVSTGSTVPSISSAVSFYDTADLYPIVITETTPGSFISNSKYTNNIRMTLPAGFNWVADAGGKVGNVTSNNNSITAAAPYCEIDGKDNGVATIIIPNKYDIEPKMLSKIILNNAKIQSKKSIAKEGDVKINMRGDNFDSTSLVIARYGTYGINLTVDKVPDRIAGRSYLNDEDSVKSGKLTFEENVEDSWWAQRRTEFVVNMGDIRAVDIKVLDDVTEAGKGTNADGISHSALVNGITVTNAVEDLSGEKIDSDKDALDGDNARDFHRGYFQGGDTGYDDYMYITSEEGSNRDFRRFVLNEFSVDSTLGNFVSGERKTRAKMELTFYVEVPATLDSADKDLTVSLEGPAINSDDKQKVKIANIKEPLTFEIEKKDVNLGYKDVELGTITVTENFVEGFSPVYSKGLEDKDLKFRVIPDSDKIDQLSEKQMDGDYNEIQDTPGSVTDGQVTGDILVKDGKIQRQSTEISKVVLKPRIDLVRYLPEGQYDFKIDGIDELGSDVTIEDYMNIITAADNKNTLYASDVKMIADGSTTTMTVGGVSKQMTAAAFIKDDRTMLPLRDVANALGIGDDGISFYDGMATIFANGTFVQATNGSKELKVNGASIPMDVAAYIDPATERMYLPLGFIANAFGVTAQWDGATKTVTLNPSVPTGTPSTKANVSSK